MSTGLAYRSCIKIEVRMDKTQKIILIIGIALLVIMSLFPPWKYTFSRDSTYSERPAGYFCIFAPPPPRFSSQTNGVAVDIYRLMIQWVAGAGLLAAAWLFHKIKSP